MKKETATDLLKKLKDAYRKDEDFDFALESLHKLKKALESQEYPQIHFKQLIAKTDKEIENLLDEKK